MIEYCNSKLNIFGEIHRCCLPKGHTEPHRNDPSLEPEKFGGELDKITCIFNK